MLRLSGKPRYIRYVGNSGFFSKQKSKTDIILSMINLHNQSKQVIFIALKPIN